MAEIELVIEDRPYYVREAKVITWLVEEGDELELKQPLMQVRNNTDSPNAEAQVLCTHKGVLKKKLVDQGDSVQPNSVIGIVEWDDTAERKLASENLFGVTLRLGVICEHCDSAIPVNGFVKEVKCSKCNEITILTDTKKKLHWKEILNYQNPTYDIFTGIKRDLPGEGDSGAWQPVKLKTWRKWAPCKHCKNEYDYDDMKKAIENNGRLTCLKCNASEQMKPAPDFIKKVFKEVLFSIDELPEDANVSGSHIQSSNPVVMTCMSCGGSLAVDGTARLVPCKFCGSNNYLPDDLWFALHPQPKMEDWFILFNDKEPGADSASNNSDNLSEPIITFGE